jgi:hypothetical protein
MQNKADSMPWNGIPINTSNYKYQQYKANIAVDNFVAFTTKLSAL